LVGADESLFVAKLGTAGAVQWSKRYGTTQAPLLANVAVDSDGSVVLAGPLKGETDFGAGPPISMGGTLAYAAKLDGVGQPLWAESFGGLQIDVRDVALSTQGAPVLWGDFVGNAQFGAKGLMAAGGHDRFFTRLSTTGAVDGAMGAGDANGQVATHLVATTGDGFFGTGRNTANGTTSLAVFRVDTNGAYVWTDAFDGNFYGHNLASDPGSSAVVAGRFSDGVTFDVVAGTGLTAGGAADVFVVKLSAAGNVAWAKALGGSGFSPADTVAAATASVATDSKGNIFVVASGKGTADFGGGGLGKPGETSEFLIKLDPTGKHIWSRAFGPLGSTGGCQVAVGSNDELVLACSIEAGSIDFGNGPLAGKGGLDMVVARFAP
jgi:hypothetical protein